MALNYPEILSAMMTFLPNSSLLNCTMVNTAWEFEARSHLLNRKPRNIDSSQLENYIETMQPRSNCHKRIQFNSIREEDESKFQALQNFVLKNASKIQELVLHWDVTHELSGTKYVRMLPQLTNLKSLGFLMEMSLYNTITQPKFIDDLIQQKCLSHNITKFRIQFPIDDEIRAKTSCSFFERLLAIFLNVRNIHFSYVPLMVIETLFTNIKKFSTLNCLSLDNTRISRTIGIEPELKFHVRILKICLGLERCEDSYLIKIFSSTLEQLHIHGVTNMNLTYFAESPKLFLPIMPKLKVLKICQTPFPSGIQGCNLLSDLILNFETEQKSKNVRMRYDKQFPELRKLIICRDHEELGYEGNNRQLSENDFFTSCVPLIYQFISGDGDCKSLDELDIPFPIGDTFNYLVKEYCQCHSVEVCTCYSLINSSDFFDRVVATFPNLRGYHDVLKTIPDKTRLNKIKEFIELGKNLGLLEVKEVGDDTEVRLLQNLFTQMDSIKYDDN